MADERAVTQALDRSSEAIRVGQLQSLLRVQVELHEEAERELRAVKLELIRLLETIAPDQTDADLVGKPPLESLQIKELISILERRLTASGREGGRLDLGQSDAHTLIRARDFEALRTELGTAKEKVVAAKSAAEALQRDLNASREQNKFLIEERKRLLEKLAQFEGEPDEEKDQPVPPEPCSSAGAGQGQPGIGETPEELPRWLTDWQGEETFERDKRLVLLLGETGFSRRPAVQAALARELGISQSAGSLRGLIARLQGEELVEVLRPWKDASLAICSHMPDLVKLSEKGRLAFSVFAGHPPKEPDLEVLSARYSSPEKALLVLTAADSLAANGYTRVEYANGNVPAPADLVAEDKDGQAIAVAVARDDPDGVRPGSGEGRWLILHELTKGNLYVICDSRASMFMVRNQINHALGSRPASIHLTNLADLQAGKKGEGGTIWLEGKRRGMSDGSL